MSEIKCPHCGEMFTVDEQGYSMIVSQVKDQEFEKAVKQRELEIKKHYEDQILLSQTKTRSENDKEVQTLKNEIVDLKNQVNGFDNVKNLAVRDALDQQKEIMDKQSRQITELLSKIQAMEESRELKEKIAIEEALKKQKDELVDKDKKIIALQGDVNAIKKDAELKATQLKERFEIELKSKDETINFYKDLKAKMSTKLVGETLEQHCQIQFNQLRMTAFPNAYFEKDNDARTGSKGDYIYKEEKDGVEFISIMFEMKNQNDETACKHKNEDFFKELDKDRREKGCEYAILVSMLEADSELYNAGIVDVSYKYPKMYVIRPQCFIPMITLLRNAALNSVEYQRQLVEVKNQNLDISHFEDDMDEFKRLFGVHFKNAKDRFDDAIKQIDDTIERLTKVKESLRVSTKHLSNANTLTQDLSIKSLTKNNPTMREKFEELEKDENK